jgi:hypothetical protein
LDLSLCCLCYRLQTKERIKNIYLVTKSSRKLLPRLCACL